MGILYSISTPIGNLEDITVRALRILKEVDSILCEDTRTTKILLKHYHIATPTEIYHQHTHPKQLAAIVERVQHGQNLAIVTDAGTPTISDPGSPLIQQAVTAAIQVVPVPGPSAVICALQAAGVDTSSFVYLGFLPHKKGRQTLLNYVIEERRTVVFYESPHRLLKTLQALSTSEKSVVVARELTKVHEEFVRGSATQVYDNFLMRPKILGECVVIVHS